MRIIKTREQRIAEALAIFKEKLPDKQYKEILQAYINEATKKADIALQGEIHDDRENY